MEEPYQFAKDVYPNIAQILKTAVERGFSLMNKQMSKLHSSMKIWTLDALMRIFYEYNITDQDADDIVKVWFKNGNQRIDLP